ncbi:hypothetical protein LSH36_100g10023 [Paralvinella palmiformis]|uniref:Uncharacterized protein n=1 Tax=Paralvinella palmiformis TaxID=53620 RepID=A0AAD9NBD0_9ANNE|nr:hypothetical protein LSH36_100g10023 [Paralvinella palmiformis]
MARQGLLKKIVGYLFSPAQPSTPAHNVSTQEMHSRLEMYASRLAEVEQRQQNSTPDSDDEHQLIAQYCQSLHGDGSSHSLRSPMQIMMAVDGDQRNELESMIKDLEDENRNLQAEYDRLRQAHKDHVGAASSTLTDDSDGDVNYDAEMIREAKLLRQHKGRLEARMQILEDHNRQLEAQLDRLRQLLDQSDFEPRLVMMTSSQAASPGTSVTSSHSSLPRGSHHQLTSSSSHLNGHVDSKAALSSSLHVSPKKSSVLTSTAGAPLHAPPPYHAGRQHAKPATIPQQAAEVHQAYADLYASQSTEPTDRTSRTTSNKPQPSSLPAHQVRQSSSGVTQTVLAGAGLKVHPPIMSTKVHDPKLQHDLGEHSSRHPVPSGMLAKSGAGVTAGEKMSPKPHHLASLPAKSSPPVIRSNIGQMGRVTPQTASTTQVATMAAYQQHQQQFDKAKAVQMEMHRSRSHPVQPRPEERPTQPLPSSQSQSPVWAKVEQAPLPSWSEAKTQPLQQWSKSEAAIPPQTWSQIKSQSTQPHTEEGSPWTHTAVQGQAWSPSCPKSYKEYALNGQKSGSLELEEVMKEIQDTFPPDSQASRGSSNVGNLFHMAGQVGKAVGTLVTVMTDEEGSGDDDDEEEEDDDDDNTDGAKH